MKKYFWIFCLIVLGCSSEEELPSPEVSANYTLETFNYNQVSNVDPNLLSLGVYHQGKENGLRPVIIYVHGGAWSIGDKSQKLDSKLRFARSEGYILVSINYRLSPFPYQVNNPDRIKHPTHSNDVADAIKWVFDNISKYGGDTSKIALLGHSAGAQLVALAGTNSRFLEDRGLTLDDIKGVGVIDTRGFLISNEVQNGPNMEMYENAFGTDESGQVDASPSLHLDRTISYPSFFIAKRGGIQRLAIANIFIGLLRNAGVDVTEVNGSKYTHAGINAAIGDVNEVVITEPLKQFYKEAFR